MDCDVVKSLDRESVGRKMGDEKEEKGQRRIVCPGKRRSRSAIVIPQAEKALLDADNEPQNNEQVLGRIISDLVAHCVHLTRLTSCSEPAENDPSDR